MSKKEGSILGGALLIAGSAIGAGMLGIPILTGLAGFFPSLVIFIGVWLFMTLTGLLFLEANSWHPSHVNLLTIVDSSLGKWGKSLCWVFYLFLFYAILVAYISLSGSMVSSVLENYFNTSIPPYIGSLFFTLLFGGLILQGTRKVDLFNRLLMFFKIGFFAAFVFLGLEYIKPQQYLYINSPKMIAAIPLLIISFGYHNMIPSLTSYFQGNMKKVRKAILSGSGFILLIYLIWQILCIGILPLEGPCGLENSLKEGKDATQAIGLLLRKSWVGPLAQLLGFFAILTSFLAQALSLTHFLADGFKISYKKQESIGLCALALFPPLILGSLYPHIFFKALNFAGGICTVILFGVLPVLMVWKGRYSKQQSSSIPVLGGKPLLTAIFLFAVFVFCYQVTSLLS